MSYARLILFTLGPGTRSTGEAIADEMFPKVKAQKGFKDISFLLDAETGEYGAVVLWESKENAEAAKEALIPVLLSKIGDMVKSPPSIKLFEVYEPKT